MIIAKKKKKGFLVMIKFDKMEHFIMIFDERVAKLELLIHQ